MAEHTVAWEVRDGVGWITLDRPARLNAWNRDLGQALLAALDEARDPAVRAVVVTGAGRAFSAGADLQDEVPPEDGPPRRSALEEVFHPAILAVRELPKPVVGAINGPTLGIGASLALACDLVCIATSAYISLAFVNIGLMPDGGATLLVARAVGKARALEMTMLGERIHGPQAVAWGLANSVHDDDALLADAEALARRLAAGPTLAYGAAKQAINNVLYVGLRDQMALELRLQTELVTTDDFREGVAAFADKRSPSFRGR